MKCLICESSGKNVEYEKASSLGTHLWKTHDMKPKEYYDKYLSGPNDGKCAECGKPTLFKSIGQGYLEFCSRSCSAKHIAADKSRNKHKISAYNNTMREQYNVANCAQLAEVKEKRKNTMLERYDVEFYSQTKEFVDKYHKTNMERWGVPSVLSLPEVRAKLRESNVAKIGVPYRFCLKMPAATDAYMKLLDNNNCDLLEFKDKKHIVYRCRKCGHVNTEQDLFLKVREGAHVPLCTACLPKSSPISGEELEVSRFIESLGFSVQHYDRDFLDKYGADMVIEDRKLVVEFDGIRWHNEMYRSDDYHVTKSDIAERMGYRLIHIFSDEWEEKRPIVESRLRYALGIAGLPVNARKCTVRAITAEEAKRFNEAYHIQGDAVSAVRYGLYKDDELVAVMTFGKARFMLGSWELIRYCVKPGYSVRGGAGRLFRHFIDEVHPTAVVTYADRRWSNGHGFYEKIGFKYDGITAPGYTYVVGNHRESRMAYQRHKLVGDDVVEGKSEHEIMYGRGIYRIYDCGNYRYYWMNGNNNILNNEEMQNA